jgi:ribosomal protein S18 acetylase RimI-like enzyme
MKIVKASQEISGQVAELFDSYKQFYGQPSDLVGATRFIGERLKTDESVIYVALADESESVSGPVGFVQLYPVYSSISMKRAWILNDLYVKPEARTAGIGRKLMKRCEELARDSGAAYLALETAKDNLVAKELYESLGYIKDVEFDHYSWSTPA